MHQSSESGLLLQPEVVKLFERDRSLGRIPMPSQVLAHRIADFHDMLGRCLRTLDVNRLSRLIWVSGVLRRVAYHREAASLVPDAGPTLAQDIAEACVAWYQRRVSEPEWDGSWYDLLVKSNEV